MLWRYLRAALVGAAFGALMWLLLGLGIAITIWGASALTMAAMFAAEQLGWLSRR